MYLYESEMHTNADERFNEYLISVFQNVRIRVKPIFANSNKSKNLKSVSDFVNLILICVFIF